MNNYLKKIELFIDHNYWTNTLGLARSLLALSTLLTLSFNNVELLFYSGILNENTPNVSEFGLNIYTWFPKLEYGYWFSIIILILTITGIYPRIICVFHWLVAYSFFTLATIADGGDQITSILTLLLIPICIFDKRKWHWSTVKYMHNFYSKCVSAIFYELIRVQVFIVYFVASVGKFSVEEWKNGTVLYYWFNEPLFGVRDFFQPFVDFLTNSPILITLTTWSVLIIELLIAFSYFSRNQKIKSIALYTGIFFHFGILLFFGLVSFFLVMTASLILFLTSKNYNYEYRSVNFLSAFRGFNNIFSNSTQKS